ncbi:MAG: hypothetical protein NTU93_12155 [Arthrobacter sp.]|nr:hypothetical protein [Arthrobacter sp.]
MNHGFSLGTSPSPSPLRPSPKSWLTIPTDWGSYAIEVQEQDAGSALNLAKAAPERRRQLWQNEVFTAGDGGGCRVENGNLLICERNKDFLVAVAIGTERVRLPASTALLSAPPLVEDGWLQPNNAAWVLRG